MFNPRWIIGKKVVKVEMNPFDPNYYYEELPKSKQSSGRGVAHSPRITFEDGSAIEFSTEETELGSYGTNIVYWPAPKKGTPCA